MLPLRVTSLAQSCDNTVQQLDRLVVDADLVVQSVFSNHVVLLAAGFVEQSISIILTEYTRNRSQPQIVAYVGRNVARLNSLNCEKTERLLNSFDRSWWPRIQEVTRAQCFEAVDSLKNLRDQIAHGRPNGTGFRTVSEYFTDAKGFVNGVSQVILS